jgi:hypothetical protein
MSNTNINNDDGDDDTFIAVPNVETDVAMYESSRSNVSIGSDSLGPCIGILIDIIHGSTPYCILDHYSYGLDEIGMELLGILLTFLYHILGVIKDELGIPSIFNDDNQPRIRDIYLLISGGDVVEGTYMRNAFLLLNYNEYPIFDENYLEKEILYLYKELRKNKIIVVKPMTKILKNKKSNKG